MTLVAAYRYGPYAIILNDFRITHDYTLQNGQVKQIDACMKFAQIGSNIGMFFAGDVELIQGIIPLIRQVESQITVENVLESNGILRQTLLEYVKGISDKRPRVFQSIGFIIDNNCEFNEMFKLEGNSSTSTLSLSQLPSGRCTIIGSGVKVPELANRLTKELRYLTSYKTLPFRRRNAFSKRDKYDQHTAAQCLERTVRSTLRECGNAVYGRLGISPHFVVSLIGHGSFIMQGGQTIEEHFTTDYIETTPVSPSYSEYSLKRDQQTGEIVLKDLQTGQCVIVQEIERYRESTYDIIFDTQSTTARFDLSSFESSDGVLYVMNQWVDENFVERTIEKCILLEDGFYCPDYIRLASDVLEPIPAEQHGRYTRSGKYVLYISNAISEEFEQNVKVHVFDHEWLGQYIQNYLDFFN